MVGGSNYTVTATATSGLTVTFSIDASASTICTSSGTNGETIAFIGAGQCVINANQAGNANYNPAPQVQQSFAVGQGSQTINFTSSPPAQPTVGAPDYPVTATGGASGNPVTFSISAPAASVCSSSGLNGSNISFTAPGTCVILANQAGDANYAAANQEQQSFQVKNGQTITFTSSPPAEPVAGGPVYPVTATSSAGLTPVTFSSATPAVCTSGGTNGSQITFVAAGTCTINANQARRREHVAGAAGAADLHREDRAGHHLHLVAAEPGDLPGPDVPGHGHRRRLGQRGGLHDRPRRRPPAARSTTRRSPTRCTSTPTPGSA